MENKNKDVKANTKTDATAITENKPVVRSLVTDIKAQLLKGVKDMDVLVKNVMAKRVELKMLKNSKGKVITEQGVRNLCNAFKRDIKNKKKGHWSTYNDLSDDKQLKIELIVKA